MVNIGLAASRLTASSLSSQSLYNRLSFQPKINFHDVMKSYRNRRYSSCQAKEKPLSSKGTSSKETPEPSVHQLRLVALHAAIPMFGFGFMDNLVMIQAGEVIDNTFGVTFGLSTMTAAGFGQCVSDVAGNTCGGIVSAMVAKLSLPHHGLTPDQLGLQNVRITRTFGGCVGVVIGCLAGMSCLLFMDTSKAERAKRSKELTSIFESIMEDSYKLVHAERATLWMVDEAKSELWSKVSVYDGLFDARIPLTTGIAGECTRTGKLINIPDAYNDERFDPEIDTLTGYRTKSIICVPITEDEHSNGKVIGVIQMINKKDKEGNEAFTENDEKLLIMLGLHVAAFIRTVGGDEKMN